METRGVAKMALSALVIGALGAISFYSPTDATIPAKQMEELIFEPVVTPIHPDSAAELPLQRTNPQASATPKPLSSPTPRPKPTAKKLPAARVPATKTTSRSVKGVATWYCEPGVSICTYGYPASGAYGAAGPDLRAAIGNWRGRTVYVNDVPVKLIDFCSCGGDHVIDVYHATWLTIPHPDSVTVSW
jgi:hypothetical protein